jgi:hypothetical protein
MIFPGLWYNERAKGGWFTLARTDRIDMTPLCYERRMRAAFLAIVVLAAAVTAVFAAGVALTGWLVSPETAGLVSR